MLHLHLVIEIVLYSVFVISHFANIKICTIRQCKYCFLSNEVDLSQLEAEVSACLLSVSTPTLLHPSAYSMVELLKDLDKADLLSLSQTGGRNVIEEIVHSGI